MKFTQLELEFIAYFMDTEYCRCGGYVFYDEWNMKVTRGVMASLVKKKVITGTDDTCSEPDYPSMWVSIDEGRYEEFGKILDENKIQWKWD